MEELFPITPAMVGTVAGSAALCVLVTRWLKEYLPDWRYTSLLSLGITLVLVEIAAAAFLQDAPILERLYNGGLVALAGASLGVFGRETVLNILGVAGVGSRSDAALAAKARDVLRK